MSTRKVEIELGELEIEAEVVVNRDGNVTLELEVGTELEGGIDCTDREVLAELESLRDILNYVIDKGYDARGSRVANRFSEAKPRGGVPSEPLRGNGFLIETVPDPEEVWETAKNNPL